jgi:hypothetical protein
VEDTGFQRTAADVGLLVAGTLTRQQVAGSQEQQGNVFWP